jgi:molecular chaperone GrpE
MSDSRSEDEIADPGFRVTDRRWWARPDTAEGGEAPDQGEAPAGEALTYVESLERQLDEYRGEIAELRGRVSSSLDEIEKIKQRTRREAERELERDRRRFLASFLEILDDVDRAIEGATGGASEQVTGGFELVRRRFLTRLGDYGVRRIEGLGDRFDPKIHDAVAVVRATEPEAEGTVAAVIAPGYALGDEMLRPVKVAVAKAP